MTIRWRIALASGFVVSLAMIPVSGLAQEPPITAEVDRKEVIVGEVFTLTVIIKGTPDMPTTALPMLEGVDVNVLSQSTASQLSIFSGQTSVLAVSHYRLEALNPGTLTIDSISITVEGKKYETSPIIVLVHSGAFTPQPDPQPDVGKRPVVETFFVDAQVDNPTPYIGEQIDYIFRFHSSLGFISSPRHQFPPFTGFWHQGDDGTDMRRYDVILDNRRYGVIELRTVLFPTVTGTLMIEPTVYNFHGVGFRSRRQLATEPVRVDVLPLPAGAPADFEGAVGQFDISASVDVVSAAVNDPVTLTVIVHGAGNIETLPNPMLPGVAGWRSFAGSSSIDIQTLGGKVIGSRSIDRIYVPNAEGEFVIPAISYSYFDNYSESYETISTVPITVFVGSGRGEDSPESQMGGDQLERFGTDIRHIMLAPDSLERSKGLVVESPMYWSAWLLTLLVVLVGGAWKIFITTRRRRAATSVMARTRALETLEIARQQEGEPYDAAVSVLISYLSEILGHPVAGLTHQGLIRLLVSRGVDNGLLHIINNKMVDSERVRFTTGSLVEVTEGSVLDDTADLIVGLDRYLA